MTLFDLYSMRPINNFILDHNSILVSSEGKFVQNSQEMHGFVYRKDLELSDCPYQYGIHSGIGESLEDTSETTQQLNVLVMCLQQTLQDIESLMICHVDGLRCFKTAIFNSVETLIRRTENNAEIPICYLDEARQLKEDVCGISDLRYQSAIDNIRKICSTAVIQNVAEKISINKNENIPEMHRLLEQNFYAVIGNDYLRSPEIMSLRECLRQIYSQMMQIYRIVDDQFNQLDKQHNSVTAIEFSLDNLVLNGAENDRLVMENQILLRQMDCQLTQIFGLSRNQ